MLFTWAVFIWDQRKVFSPANPKFASAECWANAVLRSHLEELLVPVSTSHFKEWSETIGYVFLWLVDSSIEISWDYVNAPCRRFFKNFTMFLTCCWKPALCDHTWRSVIFPPFTCGESTLVKLNLDPYIYAVSWYLPAFYLCLSH